MQIEVSPKSIFIFDLDDTLIDEYDFLTSAFRQIAGEVYRATGEKVYEQMLEWYHAKKNVFEIIEDSFRHTFPVFTVAYLKKIYRSHRPQLAPRPGVKGFLDRARALNVPLGLITDGRSVTQRNKIAGAGLEDYFTEIVISEEFGSSKPDAANYIHFEKQFPEMQYWYFGDNTSKDFIVPLSRGWKCVCLLDAGRNIHEQRIDDIHGVTAVPSFTALQLHAGELMCN